MKNYDLLIVCLDVAESLAGVSEIELSFNSEKLKDGTNNYSLSVIIESKLLTKYELQNTEIDEEKAKNKLAKEIIKQFVSQNITYTYKHLKHKV